MSTQIAPIQKGETQIFPITVANAVMTADGQPYDSNLGDAYSSTTTYNAGQYCIYNNALWKSKVDSNLGNTPTESSYWTRTSVGSELGDTILVETTTPASDGYCSADLRNNGINDLNNYAIIGMRIKYNESEFESMRGDMVLSLRMNNSIPKIFMGYLTTSAKSAYANKPLVVIIRKIK